MGQTVGHVPLYKEGQHFNSTPRDGIETYEIGGGTEVYMVRIAFVPVLEERCECAS